MKRIEVNVQTGELSEVAFTQEEEAAAQAERQSPILAKHAADALESDEIRADAKFQSLIEKTPKQINNWVQDNFPTLTLPEQRNLATITQAVAILSRRL